jgi:acyl dehydratase
MLSVAYRDLETLAGREIGATGWQAVMQEQVNAFAEATGDRNWVHVDLERAKREIGGPIAHGFLTLSLLPALGGQLLAIPDATRVLNYGVNKVRFPGMARVGCSLRLRQTCVSVCERAGGKELISSCTIEIDGEGRPGCVAETIILVFGPGSS